MYKKIYIVTEGEYSDYRIEGVFSTRKKALEFKDCNGFDNIETYDLDQEIKIEEAIWEVHIYDNSKKKAISKRCFCESNYEKERVDTIKYCDTYSYFRFYLRTDSAKKAIKIASERMAYVRAFPYLFPHIQEKCVQNKIYHFPMEDYPLYNFKTHKIIEEL